MKKFILYALLLTSFGSIHAQKLNDMVNLKRYSTENSSLPKVKKTDKRVVLLGNSITEGWVRDNPEFFASNNYIGRGISGQTSPQLLLRFRQDVINLNPVAVLINVGTNDIAENTGLYDPAFTIGNILSMIELAQANNITPILSSVLPVGEYPWRKEIKDVPQKIDALNKQIKALADEKGLYYVDYNTKMRDANGALIKEYGKDGVHPTPEGYKVMEVIAKNIVNKAISK